MKRIVKEMIKWLSMIIKIQHEPLKINVLSQDKKKLRNEILFKFALYNLEETAAKLLGESTINSINELSKSKISIPAIDPRIRNISRMYARYADDWILFSHRIKSSPQINAQYLREMIKDGVKVRII
jgi:hypothetical protein